MTVTDSTLNTIDILTPTLWRHDRLAGLAANIHQATRAPHVVTFIAEPDDADTVLAVRKLAIEDPTVRLVVNGGARNTAGAYNTGVRRSSSPFLFFGADDVTYHDGWDEPALDLMVGTIRVVGTNDLAGHPEVLAGTAATHYLVRTRYIREVGGTVDCGPGVVHFEGYPFWGPDSEIVGVARSRGVFAPCLDSVVEHTHWLTGKAQMDRTYEQHAASHELSARIFEMRRAMWEKA
jgi:hypothetical protein